METWAIRNRPCWTRCRGFCDRSVTRACMLTHGKTKPLRGASLYRFVLAVIDLEQAENAHHLKRLRGEGRGAH